MAKRSGLIVAAAVVLTLLAAGPAAATFPGRNGEIVLIEGSGGKYGTDGLYELLRFAPRFGEPTRRAVCGQPSYMEVKCDFLTGPAVSPDGARLAAFQYRAPTGSSPTIAPEPLSLWILDRDGTRLESHPLDHFYSGLRWAPDALARAVAAQNYHPSDDGDPVVVLGVHGSVCVLGGRARLAPRLVRQRADRLRQVRRDSSGGARWEPQTPHWRRGSEPSCPPHSRQVAFTRGGAIWTIPLAGGRARRLTKGSLPVWSPDGKQIAFLRHTPITSDGVGETFVFRVGVKRVRVRKVSKTYVATDDPYTGERVMGIDWRPLPRH